jgi:hypothetical protein
MSDTHKFIALVGILAVSLVIAVVGMGVHIGWLGQPVGKGGAWVGDVSAGVFTVAMVVTFVFAAFKQATENR